MKDIDCKAGPGWCLDCETEHKDPSKEYPLFISQREYLQARATLLDLAKYRSMGGILRIFDKLWELSKKSGV